MSQEGPPLAKVVDLRRWREEKGRKPVQQAPPPPPEPPRFGRLLRGLSFLAGGVLIALCAYLASMLWSVDEGRGCALAVLAPISGVVVFALHLLAWGVLGRPWAREFWGRVGSWIARKVLPARVFAGVSFALVAAGLWGGEEDPVAWEPALFWFVAFLHIAFHEIGHLLAVFGVRYRPRLLRAGPLLVEWKGGRGRIRTNRDWRFLFGGHVWFTPVRPSRAREMIVLLAGPLANVLVLGAVLAVSRGLEGSWLFSEYVRANIACTALVLLTNLVPLPRTREGYATDGRQILDLLRGRRIA